MDHRIEFHLRASGWLRNYLFVVHLVIVAAVWLIAVPMVWHLGVTAVLAVSLLLNLWRYNRQCLPVLVADGGQWRLRDIADGAISEQPVELVAPCYLSNWLVVLPLKLSSGRRQRLLIAADSLDKDQYRRLKARLQLSLASGN